jgi:hypothetical protein
MFRDTICEYYSRTRRPSDSRCLLRLMKLGRVISKTWDPRRAPVPA